MVTSSDPDWRKILKAYIGHVGDAEGVLFLPAQVKGLSDLEQAALFEVAAEHEETAQSHRDDLLARAKEVRAQTEPAGSDRR